MFKLEKEKMNVYDFDGTIYKGDSGADFIKFMCAKKPFFMTGHILKSLKYVAKYEIKKIEFKEMKEYLFSFVKSIDNLEKYTSEFAEKYKDNIKENYKVTRKNDDVVVSASLDFYLVPLCKSIGIENVICTNYDTKNGKIIGENCKGEEKVTRINLAYGEKMKIECAYGDTKGDVPMMKRAEKGYVIKGEKIIEYNDEYKF